MGLLPHLGLDRVRNIFHCCGFRCLILWNSILSCLWFPIDDFGEEDEEEESEVAAFMESYSESLDNELGETTLKNSFVRADHVQVLSLSIYLSLCDG